MKVFFKKRDYKFEIPVVVEYRLAIQRTDDFDPIMWDRGSYL